MSENDSKKATVLHRYGDRRHYSALEHSTANIGKVIYREYTFLTGYEIAGLKFPILRSRGKVPANLQTIANLLFGEPGKTVVLGAEPFDIRVPFFLKIAKRHKVIYHTSWPFWNSDRVPRPPYLQKQKKEWRKFLDNVSVITVTEAAKESISEFGFDATHIPHCVDTSVFSPNKGSDDDGDDVVLFVGRYVEQKGIPNLLEVARRGRYDNVTFRFVGDGPLKEKISEASSKLPVEDIGYISDQQRLASIYAEADVVVLPSYRKETWEELFGIVIIEAMACGTPVIATNCVGPSEIIEDGKTGFLIEQDNVAELKKAIDDLLDKKDIKHQMAREARQKTVEKFDIQKIAEKWKGEIQDI